MPEIALRPFAEDDFDVVLGSIRSADELLQWAGPGFDWPLDRAQLRGYLDRGTAEPERFRTLSAVDGGGRVVGHVQLVVDRAHDLGHFGRVLVARDARGRGVGTALMREVVRLGFDELGLHRLALHVFDFNEAAIRCYERVGFVREGRLREARRAGDGYWSLLAMGLLETDPRG